MSVSFLYIWLHREDDRDCGGLRSLRSLRTLPTFPAWSRPLVSVGPLPLPVSAGGHASAIPTILPLENIV